MSCCNDSPIECRNEFLERLGPIALRLLALAAGAAIFAPLIFAFAAPFIG